MLDFTLPLGELLQVLDERLGCQVVEGLTPQVRVSILLAPPLPEQRADVKDDFPLHRLVVPQPLHHCLAEGPGGARGAAGSADIRVLGLPVRGGLGLKGEGWMLGRLCREGRGGSLITSLGAEFPTATTKP